MAARSALQRLIPYASPTLLSILDGARGALEPPIRSEIFGPQRFAQHGRSLGNTHRAGAANSRSATFFPRLQDNIRTLREAYRYIGMQASTGYDISPAAEWLLDNFHLIEAQLKEIHEGLPRSYFRSLPVLVDEPLAGLPRIYGVAWAFVAHTDGAFDDDLLMQFLSAYQETRELNLSEMWALPTTLRVVLIENLRRLAERVASNKAAREAANLCCDRIDSYTLAELDELLALLNLRAVGRVFLGQMGQRLRHRPTIGEPIDRAPYQEWLYKALPDVAAVQSEQSIDQAADNLSVSNAVTSLRAIGDADWPDIVGESSSLMRLMLSSATFSAEDIGTRDQTLHGIERLAKLGNRSELSVAHALLRLMQSATADAERSAVAGYWLFGMGRAALVRGLNVRESATARLKHLLHRLVLPIYLGASIIGTFALTSWLLRQHEIELTGANASGWLALCAAILMLFPASEAIIAIINRLISESAKPRRLPRFALINGIPAEHRVMVAIPAMLTSVGSTQALVHQLKLHFLANPEANAQFALLSDWADADSEHVASDQTLLDAVVAQISELNSRYPQADGCAPRFIVLHRQRQFSETEQRWIGWERKRGKLELLVSTLAEGTQQAFIDLGRTSMVATHTQYIVTVDSDTQLPPGRLRELIGVAAHPQNQPQLDVLGTRVIGGYGILQPRVVTPLPAAKTFTLYHWLFAGQCGIDPYSAATSEVYQDLFNEGTFTGKGLLNVRAMHAVLGRRLPEGQVLSHDLLEGAIARCAAVTDVTLIEDAPTHADVAASRVHRWTRGDWQLLPILLGSLLAPMFGSGHYPLRAINRWKMFDNLRRSLVAPMSLALLVLALATSVLSPWAALALVLAAFLAGPLMGAVAGFAPSRDDVALRHFYWRAATDLLRALCGGLWHLATLLQQALLAVDAIVRALYRMLVSHQRLLQWTTAAAAQVSAKTNLKALLRTHWSLPVVALALLAVLLATGTRHPELALSLCLMWAASAVWIWWVSRVCAPDTNSKLPHQDQAYLEGIARDTWRLFERCVVADDNHLPPDNLQTLPHDMVAHRTSPTNIGLYLLSAACARQFGWIGTQDLLVRLDATMATLATMQRYRGHFMNWYDTQTAAPLLPMYVSTVDSGNLSGHLLAVAQACLELANAPLDQGAPRRAIQASRHRLTPLLHLVPGDSAMSRLLALSDPVTDYASKATDTEHLLDEAAAELIALSASDVQRDPLLRATPHDELIWCLADHVATLRSALFDAKEITAQGEAAAALRLRKLAQALDQLAWQPDFSFLYHRKRHLLHIGFRVAEQQLDASFYDLLASESRLASLLAVSKGDVPTRHWSSLGRPFYAIGTVAGLRSWSGSMFEYLMPSLVLNEPYGSVLRDACTAALGEQIAFTTAQGMPWGISESAYAGRDETLAYQYAPQGVPRLALRRTPPDELVIAPYATALAALVAPHRATLNFAALEKLSARGRYGFIEALDYSPSRQTGTDAFTPVATFMAHHQGMTIVALASVLLDAPGQRWGMANAHIESVASLLHERAPREVSKLYSPPPGLPTQLLQMRAPSLLREVQPGAVAVDPTHVLSNGRYSVMLRANGAGSSRRGQTGITRSRDDALRDSYGSFFYLRWKDKTARPGEPQTNVRLASITHHPAGDPTARYSATYHADRVCFDAAWHDVKAHTTVWVSPEDDIEFRQIELQNLTDRALDIELISAFDVTLTDARADEAHPAFSNFFVRAHWLAHHQALLFERTPRLATERGLRAAHFIAESDPQIVAVRVQTDRQRWLGRNRAASEPLAEFDSPPNLSESASPDTTVTLDTGLDPVCAMAVRLRIAPSSRAQLTFATAASEDHGTLRAVIDKYRQSSHVKRASLMSATLTGIRLRALRITAENQAAIQTLTSALVHSLTRPHTRLIGVDSSGVLSDVCDRRLLWRFGISGDRPLLLVWAGIVDGLGLLRTLTKALRLWSRAGVACDLVVVNAEPVSYQLALQREIASLRERYVAESDAEASAESPSVTGFYLLRTDEISIDELSTLQNLARVRLNADGRPLSHHIKEWNELHERAFAQRREGASLAVAVTSAPDAVVSASAGEFATTANEFRFDVGTAIRPGRPWINVLSNPEFGAQLTEAGGGYTWAVNSRMNQLTAWSNDPVADSPSEWFLLQDVKTLTTWSVSPCAQSDDVDRYRVAHGQGYSVIRHHRGELEVTTTWCVDAKTSVKQVRLRLVNRGHRTQVLRLIGIMEWMMGANRSDRSAVRTVLHQPTFGTQKITALLSTQRERSGGFGDGTAFLSIATAIDATDDWTCDRRECFDAFGRLTLPDRFGRKSGVGLDPCAALATRVILGAGEAVEHVFLIGYATNPGAARELVALASAKPALDRVEQVRKFWDELLGATTVKTPDPLFDAMVNRWLLYQTVACRMWAKAGFYQAGGATGFRDQLQDSMALAWAAPKMLRDQIVLCASRQYAEGDVQHWWHSPGGAGVRTHFSDDLLWLAYACAHYLRVTGDATILDAQVPFIEGVAIPEGAEDAYYTPTVSADTASVYEHAARAIDHSLRVGIHGLPLMGSGDWNDGMNRVGHKGRGESVWLGWFLCKLVAECVPVAKTRGDVVRAERWQDAATGWKNALLGVAWDGEWFKRAFFDDGQALGSHVNQEAKIDLIAQAWAVLSGVAPAEKQRAALISMATHLVDDDAGLLRLLDPPFSHAAPSAGYIQAYPPGVRENGGQYSHGAVWALMAQAEFATSHADAAGTAGTAGESDLPYRYFTYLSPAHRATQPKYGAAYGIEPYVMAGDVYAQPPYVGRGGWSWYTGAAAWMHRAAVESIFGLQQTALTLSFKPCLPLHWPQAELTLKRDGRTMRFIFNRGSEDQAMAAAAQLRATLLRSGESVEWTKLAAESAFIIALPLR